MAIDLTDERMEGGETLEFITKMNNLMAKIEAHAHNELYYTQSQIAALLVAALEGHDHNDLYYTEVEITALLANKASLNHVHDGRYYTESEIDNLISNLNTASKLNKTNGVSTGMYDHIVAMAGTSIDVSAGNVHTKTISANTTFSFTGFTANASIAVLELTASNSPIVTFPAEVDFKTTPVIAEGINTFVFTSTDNGATIYAYVARDDA